MLEGKLNTIDKRIVILTDFDNIDDLFEILNYEMVLLRCLVVNVSVVKKRIESLSKVYFDKNDKWSWEETLSATPAILYDFGNDGDRFISKSEMNKKTKGFSVKLNNEPTFHNKYDFDCTPEDVRKSIAEQMIVLKNNK